MNTLRLLRMPLAAVALMAMLTGCGEVTAPDINTPDDTSPPQQPSGMGLQYDELGNAFLTWAPNASPNVVGTFVYNYSAPNSYSLINTSPADNALGLPAVNAQTTYTFRLRALNKNGVYSSYTNDFVVTLYPKGPHGTSEVDAN